jgi:hypothetical protein
MLPDVDADDGCVRDQRVLIRGGDNLKGLVDWTVALWQQFKPAGTMPKKNETHEPAPARALNTRGRGVELLDESIEGAPLLLDSLGERAIL